MTSSLVEDMARAIDDALDDGMPNGGTCNGDWGGAAQAALRVVLARLREPDDKLLDVLEDYRLNTKAALNALAAHLEREEG